MTDKQPLKVFFDLDGVLADWEYAFKQNACVTLKRFNGMSKAEKDEVKQNLFDYEFFYCMRKIERGMELYQSFVSAGVPVAILSATGHINKDEVTRAKMHWVADNLGSDVRLILVDKVDQKGLYVDPAYRTCILVDDRQKAIDAWEAAGGRGLLFK
ncbi:hypothetical protein pf16_93 [Pseudomonas phage pf16]|uniref:Uncharacterized protein n=1 Tax=Pseudomonas phage pf16 TaxID=1815630 RepID=A0A1S5R3W2_9CAUD|nr:5'-3' deoxyribonucleotidase [Pseudomonas phage pf16]AND75016.1 hypothetical protein pf16_93 [Pseudomonas phage pf16]